MKKIGFAILVIVELLCVAGIYFVGGQVGPWIWSACVFVVAPIACMAFVVQSILVLIRLCKKKAVKWNILYMAITLIMAYPITILFGIAGLTYPTHASDKEMLAVINPVENSILLGGKDYKTHAVWPSECYAYDILKEPYNINSAVLTDYGIYLADVYCPVSGTVIALEDSEENILPNTEDFKSALGNYIFIEVEETGTYLILAHLEKDSVDVAVGDHVTQGMLLARVGNSGTTSEPHLHMQHQKNNPMEMQLAICAEGLPMQVVGNKE